MLLSAQYQWIPVADIAERVHGNRERGSISRIQNVIRWLRSQRDDIVIESRYPREGEVKGSYRARMKTCSDYETYGRSVAVAERT